MSETIGRVKDFWNEGSCGTEHTDEEKHTKAYFEEIEEFRYRHEPFVHSFAQFTRWRGAEGLEVGVGAGTDFIQWLRAGVRMNGVDLTEEAIENVSRRLAVYDLQAESLQVVNAEKLPFEDDRFDLVYSWGVIHHTDNMEKALSEIYRVTRPGGRIKIMIYNINSFHTWYLWLRFALLRGKLGKGRRWAACHFQESYATKVYSRREIIDMLSAYKHSGLCFYFWDQLIRSGARFESVRRFLQNISPRSMRWYMAFEFDKK